MNEVLISVCARTESDLRCLADYWPFLEEGLLPSTPVLRFVRLDHVKDMLERRFNVLARVTSWKDNYEGIMRAFRYEHDSLRDFWNSYYGQSWTLTKYDSELLWNARSHDKNYVCLRSTVGRLVRSVLRVADVEKVKSACSIGRVNYDEGMLRDYVDKIRTGGGTAEVGAMDYAEAGFIDNAGQLIAVLCLSWRASSISRTSYSALKKDRFSVVRAPLVAHEVHLDGSGRPRHIMVVSLSVRRFDIAASPRLRPPLPCAARLAPRGCGNPRMFVSSRPSKRFRRSRTCAATS